MILLFVLLILQHNDDPELWAELKRKEVEYEKRRNKKVQYYESVRHAQTVQVDEIPLPQVLKINAFQLFHCFLNYFEHFPDE